jgi:protein TonB
VLHAIIGKDGSIQSLQLISGPKELAPAAWDAVKQWTYKPYLLNGEPTAVDTTIMVNFNLNNSQPEPGSAPNQ